MTTSNDPDAIRADIERTRAELSYNVDTLGETANPKNIADRQVAKVKNAGRSVREHIFGSDDPDDGGVVGDRTDAVRGRVGEAGDAVQQRASDIGDAVSGAPAAAKQKTRGNPLAAGLIAFGAGLLISGLIPSSQKEQQAVGQLQEKLEPLKEQAAGVVQEMGDNLRPQAQEAVESVKATAQEGAANVKDEGVAAKDKVQGQAASSKDTVVEKQQST